MPNILLKPSNELIELPQNSVLTDIEGVQETVLSFGCRSGACGVCLIEILAGISNLTEMDEIERTFIQRLGYSEERFRLACQCRLQGDIIIRPIAT